MSVYLRIDINLIAAILLGVVVYIAHRRLDKQDLMNRAFISVSKIVFFQLLVEAGTCIINGIPQIWLIPVAIILHISLFVTAPILTYYWYYLTKNIVPGGKTSKLREILLLLPLLLNTLLSLFSPVFNLVFYISSSNIYHRGPFFFVSMAIMYFYLLMGTLHVIKNRNKLDRKELMPLGLFCVLPIIGGLVQGFFYGPLLMWSSAAFSLVLIYIFLQERLVHLDYSTGVWNNRSFYYYLNKKAKQGDIDKLGVIYVELDGLEETVDEESRKESDSALQTFADIIKGAVRKSDITARLGEKKFGVIVDCEGYPEDFLEKMTERLSGALSKHNNDHVKGYHLSFSLYSDIIGRDNGGADKPI